MVATALVILVFLAFPFAAPARVAGGSGALADLLNWLRTYDRPATALPSFIVIWSLLAAVVFSARASRLRTVWWVWAVLVVLSGIAAGLQSIVELLAGLIVFLFVMRLRQSWNLMRRIAERIGNSWHAWIIGPVRVINYGIYAGIGTFIGFMIVGYLLGPDHIWAALLVAFVALIGSAAWAQLIGRPPMLLRPYAFYGGVAGIIVGSVIAWFMGTSPWLLLGGFSVCGAFVQATGRLRCLVQGCCHGRPAPEHIGIRFYRPQSRVLRISNLGGQYLHPTQLYSILWNVVVAVVMVRLWSLHVPLSMIGGMYMILTGMGRFVEESYRGEPQTPILGRLRLYNWIGIVTAILGAAVIAVPSLPTPSPHFSWPAVAAAFGFGLIVWFAYGVDFPKSNKRFSRLL
jgi:prolipoprotein diacylglyceryltransferase